MMDWVDGLMDGWIEGGCWGCWGRRGVYML